MSDQAGRTNSPPPETQSGSQIGKASSGQGTESTQNKNQTPQDQLKNLSSNPKGQLEDAVREKFERKVEKDK